MCVGRVTTQGPPLPSSTSHSPHLHLLVSGVHEGAQLQKREKNGRGNTGEETRRGEGGNTGRDTGEKEGKWGETGENEEKW